MNKYQRLIIIVAAMNVLLMLLFPPFANQPLAKGMIPGLQGFYPVFMQFGKQPVFTELLTLELLFIAINTLIAWLLLKGGKQYNSIALEGGGKHLRTDV